MDDVDELEDESETLPGQRRAQRDGAPGWARGRLAWTQRQFQRGVEGGWARRRWLLPIIAGVLLVAILLVAAASVVRSRQPAFLSQRVTQGDITVSIATTGTIRSAIYDADFVVPGKVSEIAVKVGQSVTVGQALAKIDDTALKDAVAQAQADYTGARSVLSSAQANQDKVDDAANSIEDAAYDQEQRDLAACASNDTKCTNAARSKYDSAVAQAEAMSATAQQQVDAAQANVSTTQAALQTAQDNEANATLKAPHAGTVAAINGHIGGDATGSQQPFIQIYDLQTLQITSMVDENAVGSVKQGQSVHFTVATYAGDTYSGTVTGVSPIGEISGDGVAYPVAVDVDTQSLNANHNLLPGMQANLTIITAQHFGVLLLPAQAVTFAHTAATRKDNPAATAKQITQATQDARQLLLNLQNDGDISPDDHPQLGYVFVLAKGKWAIKGVVLGVTNGKQYEALAGLEKGDRLATADQLNWITILRGEQQ